MTRENGLNFYNSFGRSMLTLFLVVRSLFSLTTDPRSPMAEHRFEMRYHQYDQQDHEHE
jgi:hypothetical protein